MYELISAGTTVMKIVGILFVITGVVTFNELGSQGFWIAVVICVILFILANYIKRKAKEKLTSK